MNRGGFLLVFSYCEYCGGEGEVLAPGQCLSEEPRYVLCPLCKGDAVHIEQVPLAQDEVPYPDDYDPFDDGGR